MKKLNILSVVTSHTLIHLSSSVDGIAESSFGIG